MKQYGLHSIESAISARNLLVPLDVLLLGATGVGKSSTLNALFANKVAKVGTGVDPETQHITDYRLNDYLRFHDSAGLGDGKAADCHHAKNIIGELLTTCNQGKDRYIDLVVVILDGGSRDLGTTFRLLEEVVLKNIEPERIIIGINQADMAMKRQHWNQDLKRPDPTLLRFLDEKAKSIAKRLKDSTGLTVAEPVYYSAEFNYNMDKFMDHFIQHIPSSRRKADKYADYF